MIRRPPRSTLSSSSAASDVYKRQEHPGGVDTLTDVGGADGTADFENVGHSESAKQQLKKYLIGELPEEEKKMKIKKQSHDAGSSSNVAIAFVVVLVGVVLFLILQK
eukprot:TRINITY_DN27284_c0_g1_i1.p4 TRINITY_DN27284_c0_g1~~TRINITY_DN27284_c0_g1_i1.p4  ORF type:complete len:107 (-),score=56.30 TRINITY_DN27284_c0_g1_i1:614-934(-)